MTPVVPKLIQVLRRGSDFSIKIDGERFPYAIPGDCPIEAEVSDQAFPTVRLSLMAERVEVVNDLSVSGGPPDA